MVKVYEKKFPFYLLFFYDWEKNYLKYYYFSLSVPPTIEGDLTAPSNKQVIIGQSLILECKAAGNPPPILTWLKERERANPHKLVSDLYMQTNWCTHTDTDEYTHEINGFLQKE